MNGDGWVDGKEISRVAVETNKKKDLTGPTTTSTTTTTTTTTKTTTASH